MKKILVVDDSALMRRVLCDIIDSDERFRVVARATNGLEAFDLLSRNQYDAVVLDVNMPKMNGLELLKELQKYKIPAKVMMASTDTREGAKTTLDALELGALDFIHKPDNALDCRVETFRTELLRILEGVASGKMPVFKDAATQHLEQKMNIRLADMIQKTPLKVPGKKVVAIASSTGGPKSLQTLISGLPATLDAPVLVVQHMPKGFTASLAERLDANCKIKVVEAQDGQELSEGCVYIAMGGRHMKIRTSSMGRYYVQYTDEPPREGVRPCANYMYESLKSSLFDKVVCAVMTGMGADGTEGIRNLKDSKKVHVIAQDRESCVVYGMPKSIVEAGLADQVISLEQLAQEIVLQVGIAVQ
ncbi:MAG: chemotaxis-specific protein-glutamate methyltransferase CheB [Lachnospiraceae bacterium]|nr:chemotaxis-specific protein-glutamate methyltransferase CheB [Lachnospiraceae bacterium]